MDCLAHMTTDMAELQPDYLAYLNRTGHVPSESRLTFLDNSLPFSDLDSVGCYYPLSGRRNTIAVFYLQPRSCIY